MAKNGGYLLVDLDECFDLKFNTGSYVDLMSSDDDLINRWRKVGNKLINNMLKGNKPIVLCNLKTTNADDILYDVKITPINAFTIFIASTATLILHYSILDSDGSLVYWKLVFDLDEDLKVTDVTLTL